MEIRVSATGDVHDHSLALDGWEQVYRQMTPGRFQSKLVQATSSDFNCFRESTNRRLVQAGVSPKGVASIAVPLYAPLSGTFQSRKVEGYALMTLGPDEEFRFYTPEAMHYVGVSLPVEKLIDLVTITVSERAARLLKQNVLALPCEAAAVLRARLAPLLDALERDPTSFSHPASDKYFQDGLLSVLLGLLDGLTQSQRDITHITYSDIVRRCENIAQGDTLEPVTVLDLCRELRCSRRTLQNSFQRVANVTPVEYLRTMRLNEVHRLLRSTNADEVLIGDAAARWGFTHLGYFAREYRALFGELPSQTLRKS